jgi:HEAT repeat protein
LLGKAVRARQLYLPNNPVYQGAVDALRTAFAPIWHETDEVALTFADTEIRWLGHVAMSEPTKAADSLPWTFFKDGVRELRFAKGFEDQELAKFLDILQRVRKASPEEDDLLTMLWEADFANLRYRYVDLGTETVAPLDGAPSDMQPPASGVVAQAMREAPESSRQGVVNMQDFDATLYFLDESELDHLRREIEREYQGDLRQNVLAILLDIFEAQAAQGVREEVTEIIETMMLLMLASGELNGVAYLLSEVQEAATRAANVTAQQRARLGELPDRLSAPEPLGQLLQSLDESADLPPQAALSAMIAELRPAALETILSWLGRLHNPTVRALVESAAERLASGNLQELARLVQAKEPTVALEAMRRCGAMKTTAAVPAIARVLADGATPLRHEAVQTLAVIGTPGAMQALERAIDDADRDVRVSAVRTLGASKYRGVFARLEQAVQGRKLREADLTEKMAFFEAYGAMCGDGGIEFLDGLLNGKGIFGKREDPELRACAAMALGRVGTKKAHEALQRSTGEKDIVVRNAVSRAMRGGGE